MLLLSIKHEIRHFHVLLVQKRQINVQKSAMHVQSCCFVIKHLFLDVLVAVAWLNFKVPNLKQIGDHLQPKPGGIIDYGSWPKQSPHHNTISRYTSTVNIILTNFRTKIHKWYSAILGEQIPMSLICL